MAMYSYSKLEMFNQCKLKFKFKYIDRVPVDVPTTIELFLGDLVHRALHLLYLRVQEKNKPKLEDIIFYFNKIWTEEFTDDIVIVKNKTAKEYREMGEKFLTNYFFIHQPFDNIQIVGLETNDRVTLADGSQYYVRIDKLLKKGNTYYVCDYKTNRVAKTKEELEHDTQLTMYGLWVKKKFKDCEKVELVWHFLSESKDVVIERSKPEMEKTEQNVVQNISLIKNEKQFKPTKSRLCQWCVYKSQCPVWNKIPQQMTLGDF